MTEVRDKPAGFTMRGIGSYGREAGIRCDLH